MTPRCVLGTVGLAIGGALGGASGAASVGTFLLPGPPTVSSVQIVLGGFYLGALASALLGLATFCAGLLRWPFRWP